MTSNTTSSSAGLARRLVRQGLPVLAAATVVVAAVAWSGDLRAPLVTHWAGDSAGDGTAPVLVFVPVMTLLVLVVGLLLQHMTDRVGHAAAARTVGGLGLGMSLFVAALAVATLDANRGAGDLAVGEVPLPLAGLLVALGLLLVGGLVGAGMTPEPTHAPTLLGTTPTRVEPGEAVVWTGTARPDGWMLVLALGMVLVGVLLLVLVEPFPGLLLVGVAVLLATTLRVRVLVGPGGITVRTGPFGVVRLQVPLARVTGVDALEVDPMAYGGWGVRALPGVRAVVVRAGEGIRVRRSDGPDLVVTVDDARRGAGVLLAHRELVER